MKTQIIKPDNISLASSLLKSGEIVAIPTETVYGLAADATNDLAIEKIFLAKGRPKNHPLIVHINDYNQINYWAKNIPEAVKMLAKNFWPGALTIILEKQEHVSKLITGGLNTVAIRIPNNNFTLKLIKSVGHGVVAPSANKYKSLSPTKASHVLKTLSGKISGVINHEKSEIGIESTILDMTQDIPKILRSGIITREKISKVLNTFVEEPLEHNISVSGNMKDHYQPNKPLYIFSMEEILRLLKEKENNVILYFSELSADIIKKYSKDLFFKMPLDYKAYSAILYSNLHEADTMNIKNIIVERPPLNPNWNCVHDRLNKASKKNNFIIDFYKPLKQNL